MSNIASQVLAGGVDTEPFSNNPEVTFFRDTYKRFPFYMTETISVDVEGNKSYGSVRRMTIPRFGDLVGRIRLCFVMPAPPDNSDDTNY